MKPFDLKKALAGEKVVTKDGKEVTQLHLFEAEHEDNLYGVVEGDIYAWFPNGRYDNHVSDNDLFMATKTKSYWVNCHKDHGAFVYSSKELAEERRFEGFIKCIEVSWEED